MLQLFIRYYYMQIAYTSHNNIFITPASYKKYLKIKLNYKKIFN